MDTIEQLQHAISMGWSITIYQQGGTVITSGKHRDKSGPTLAIGTTIAEAVDTFHKLMTRE